MAGALTHGTGCPRGPQEDDAASRGVFDQRPAMIIHQPGQTKPQTVATAWPIIQIHGVVEQVLHGQPDLSF